MTPLAVLLATYRRDDPLMLEEALGSVLNQELPAEYEVRIYLGVDGPIPAQIERVIDRHAQLIYRTIRSPRNEGLARTLNRLIKALGEESYVFRMDADDLSLPTRFRKQIEFLCDHPEVDIVGTDIAEWDRASNVVRNVSFARDHVDAVRKISRRVPVAHPTVCFRRRVFDRIAQYPCVAGNEDIAMWFECVRLGLRFGNVHEPLLLFSISQDFWARRSFAKALSEFRSYVRGIWMLHGCTWRYAFPLMRLVMRVSPRRVVKYLYGTLARNY